MDTAKKIQGQYSLAEYLKLEEEANSKHEYWNGTILAMAGGTPSHNKIANSIGTAIDIELDKMNKDCSVYNSDQKVYISAFNRCVYPDCMLICGEEELHENSTSIIVNPSLIIEVLSETSKEYDSNSKFEGYRSIPSFKEYVLVWQTIPKVQSWFKEEKDLWRISSAFGLNTSIPLYSISSQIALKDIYKRVKNLGIQDEPGAW